ncbi:MAG: tRNA guanosine(34) transglycosylase Tgt [Holosporales bacterium]|jgi:queuine tRNA-ribosyltransferase|nr:tRNA guanosine(34) transglycosylase Tgt [Holosporales bacterium]
MRIILYGSCCDVLAKEIMMSSFSFELIPPQSQVCPSNPSQDIRNPSQDYDRELQDSCHKSQAVSHSPCPSSNAARLGRLSTPHGAILTPAFVFCATKGAIKGATMEDVCLEQTQVILANTYHLMPSAAIVRKLGGLAKMSGWNGPTLTDSGGYQVFSMGHGSVAEEIKGNRRFPQAKSMVRISEDGATFKSCINGDTLFLSPEVSVEIQEQIGADLIFAFDECTPYHVSREYTDAAMRRSHRWEKRSLEHFAMREAQKQGDALPQAMYGIVQGGVYEDLRRESCAFVNGEPFFGQAIGGSLGASKAQMQDVISLSMQHLRKDRPVHLLGIGHVADIFDGVMLGIDTFDCVHPTRIARHGGALVKGGGRGNSEHINLRNSAYVGDASPIDPHCPCQTCRMYSRGYLNHLLRIQEMAALILISRHNIRFMNDLMAAIREGIASGTLAQVRREWLGAGAGG